jgi:LmeA-like phospholipid-binding
MTNRSDGLTRSFARPRPRSSVVLRVRRTVAVLLVLVALAVGVDYGAAALAESAVSRHMREQLNLADDPSVRFNNFPFLAQVVAGTYRSVDVTAEHISVGPLRDVQLRTQLRGVQVPLSELLGGPRTVTVREAEGTVRIGPPDVERLLTGVDKLWIDGIDAKGLEEAVEDGADPALAQIDPATAARMGGTVEVLGEEQPVSAIAVLELTDGQVQIVPRDVQVGDTASADLPAAAQRTLSRLFTIRLDPGDLPLDVTPTKARVSSGGLEISGLTGRLVLGAGAPAA